MKILIDSLSRRLGDTLQGLPFTSMYKYMYGENTKITYACSSYDFELFKNISTIDNVCLQSIFSQSNRAYDKSFDKILRGDFNADEKFHPEQIFGDLDHPDGWNKCIEKYPIVFNYKQKTEIVQLNNNKKNIGIFINFPRPDSSNPIGAVSYPLDKWQEVIDIGDKYNFFVFTSLMERNFELNNCINLKQLSLCEEIAVIKNMDVIIGCSSGFMDVVACFAQKPLIILNTCEEDKVPCWNGVPDKCTLPQNRFAYFIMGNEDIRSFIKPPDGAKCTRWDFSNYFMDTIEQRQMRVLEDIKPEIIINEIDRILKDGYGIEWFIKGFICDNCSLYKYGHCLYNYKPRLKNGQYYRGGYND